MTAIAIASSGVIAAVGDNSALRLWDLQGRVLDDLGGRGRAYTTLAFAPGGDALVLGGTGMVDVWRVEAGKLTGIVTPLEGPFGVVNAVAMTSDGSRVITAGDDGRAWIWDAHKGKQLASRGGRSGAATALGLSGDTLWIGTESGIGAWNVRVETRSVAELEAFRIDKHVVERLGTDDVVRRTGD